MRRPVRKHLQMNHRRPRMSTATVKTPGAWQARQMEVQVLNQVSSSFFTGRAGFSGSSAQQAGLSSMY